MKRLLFFITVLGTLGAAAQVTNVPGYYVTNEGNKVEVYFANSNYNSAPSEVVFMKTMDGMTESLPVSSVQEFGLNDGSLRFKRFNVLVNTGSFQQKDATTSKQPNTEQRTVFLQQLIDGEIDLFVYKGATNTSYYAQKGSDDPQLLVYNVYLSGDSSSVLRNLDYQRTLFKDFGCENFETSVISGVEYRRQDLIDYITKANECLGAPSTLIRQKATGKTWSFSVGAAVNFMDVTADFTTDQRTDADFSELGFSPSVRAEYMIDKINNKFSLIGELSYNIFKGESTYINNAQSQNNQVEADAELTYNTLGIAIGPRYYIYASDQLRFYPGAQLQVNIVSGSSELLYDEPAPNDVFATDISFNLMAGVEFNNKLSLEAKLRLRGNYTTANASPAQLNGSMFSVGAYYRIF